MNGREEFHESINSHSEQYVEGMKLEIHVLLSYVAYLQKGARKRNVGGKKKKKAPSSEGRFSFLQIQMPATIKHALLSMWIAPMCSVAITALDSSTPPDMRAAILSEWIESLRRELALFHALGFRGAKDVSEVLPEEDRISLAHEFGVWMQGVGRSLEAMSKMDPSSQGKHRSNPAG